MVGTCTSHVAHGAPVVVDNLMFECINILFNLISFIVMDTHSVNL